jgi:hypothetical protein
MLFIMANALLDPTVPYPPRYRWLKRVTVAGVIIAAAVVATRLWWGHVAQQRFDAFAAEKRARGEPVFPADLQPPPTTDGRNAAFYFLRAAGAVSKTAESPANGVITTPDYLPYHPKWHEMAAKSVAANAAIYLDVRVARGLPDVDWGVAYTSPLMNVLLPHLNNSRKLANVLGDTALYHHFNGHDAEALELIADGRALGRAADEPGFMLTHLVAAGVDALFLNRLETMAGGLQVAGLGPPATQPSARPAARQQVDALIAELLNDAPYQRNRRRALQGEAVGRIDTVRWVSRDSVVLRPMYLLDAIRAGQDNDRYLPAFENPSLATRVAQPPPLDFASDFTTSASRMFSQMTNMTYNRVVQVNAQVLAERRFAAIALAMRLCFLEQGRYPVTLDLLVPRYLPAVPVDPFDPKGGPMRYVLLNQNGQPRPVAYSVGENGVDDTGATPSTATVPGTTQWGWHAKVLDQHRDLSQWMPPAPPAGYANPLNVDPDSPEAGGNE